MIFVYISIFLFGVISTGVAIWANKAFIVRQNRLEDEKRHMILAEEDGWIKTKHDFAHWTDRKRMKKWRKSIEEDLTMSTWIEENVKGYFKVEHMNGIRYIKFAEEEDGVAFKLRWY